jgi:hypothetical protein
MVIKGDFVLLGQQFRLLADQVMLLVAAVKQGGAKGVGPGFLGLGDRFDKAHIVAETAAVILVENNLTQILPQTVVTMIVNPQVLLCGKLLHGLKTSFEFLVRMNIRIVEKTADLDAFSLEHLERIDGTGTAADVK